jgi:hypothetical protein
MKLLRLLAALPLINGVIVASALATPITSIEGVVSSTLLVQAAGTAGATDNTIGMALSGGLVLEFNDASVGPLIANFGGPAAFGTITGVTVNGDLTTYALTPLMFTKSFFVSVSPNDSAAFQVTLIEAVVDSLDPDTVVFFGPEMLAAETAGFSDFSPFAGGGLFTMTLTNTNTNFNTVFSSGGFLAPNGPFAQTATAVPVPVPEPGTLVLLASGVAGAIVRRLVTRSRRSSRRPATVRYPGPRCGHFAGPGSAVQGREMSRHSSVGGPSLHARGLNRKRWP